MEPVVDVAGLRVRRQGIQALDGVDLQAYAGQIVLVAGDTGSGKSTLGEALCGFFADGSRGQAQGCARVGGRDALRSGPAQMARSVGMLFQNPASQLFCLSVRSEVEAGIRCAGFAPEEIDARAREAMDATAVSHLAARRPWELSSGEQQRVALAAVLAMGSSALVLDEPTSYLDDASCDRLSATLRHLAAQGVCIIAMEHRWDRLAIEPDLTVVMDAGRIVSERRGAEGPPPALPFGGMQSRMVGAPLLEMTGAGVTRGDRQVLENVTVRVRAGDRLAVLGPNGSGKSTLARAMAGLEGAGRRARSGRGRAMLVQSNAAVQLLEDTVGAEIGSDSTAEALGLADLLHRPPTRLSLGQQMRVVVGAALASRPDVLILDEPSIGQDGRRLAQMLECADRILGDRGACVIMTHDARLARLGAQRVYDVTERAIGEGDPAGRRSH